ncbi:MAG TPA: hypothetical protein VFF48_09465 [Brevundimonas sp.]|nr:hypothetical protein [Brevundimonas sp.]
MKAFAVMFGTVLALAACGERTDTPAAASADAVRTPTAGVEAAAAPVPVVMTDDRLRRVCRAGLAAIHGQRLQDIQIDGVEARVVDASWRAPVNGGRRRAQCRVEGDLVTWKQIDAPNPEQNRWMNQSGDPVTRFAVDGGLITITTTLPDGTTAAEEYAVAAEQEAR